MAMIVFDWLLHGVAVLLIFCMICLLIALGLAVLCGRAFERSESERTENHFDPGEMEILCRSAGEASPGPPVPSGHCSHHKPMNPSDLARAFIALFSGLIAAQANDAAAIAEARRQRDEALANDAADAARIVELNGSLDTAKAERDAALANDATDAETRARLEARVAELEAQIAAAGTPLTDAEKAELDKIITALGAAAPLPVA